MRILHVINDTGLGGAQTLIESLATDAPRIDMDVHCLVLSAPGVLSERLEEVCQSVSYLDISRESWRVDRAVVAVHKAIGRISPDLVQSHLLQSDLISAIALWFRPRMPLVWTIHSSGYGSGDRWRTRTLAKIIRIIAVRPQRVVACTDSAAQFAISQGITPSKIVTIRNGTVLPQWNAPGSRTDAMRLVHVGRMHAMKDHNTLLTCFALLTDSIPGISLTCVGANGDELAVLSSGASKPEANRIHALGSVKDPIPIIRSSDFLIISSSYGEALPMSGIEALALGVPVLTTSVGSCPELVVEPWQMCPPNDPIALANVALTASKLSNAQYRELSQNSRKLAEKKFDIEQTSSSYLSLYEEVVS
ncbi:glycosyltransferase [Rhodococcus sp. NPDC077669]|uniref:glycosyltransferase n=1 Tax=Rhodococcus sp. NPDC077669 TaxID=3155174 RepID=UPI00341E6F42